MGTMARTDSTIALAALTAASGCLDVSCFTRLGGAFASVMTSNMVFIAFAAVRADATLAEHCVAALCGYITGVAAGSALAQVGGKKDRFGEPPVNLVLACECAVLAVVAVWWIALGAQPAGGQQTALLGVAALAMGMQGAAARQIVGQRHTGTTYLTGTLTDLVAAVATGRRPDPVALLCLAGLLVGAAIAAVLLRTAADLTTLFPALMLAIVSLLSWRRRKRHSVGDHPSAA